VDAPAGGLVVLGGEDVAGSRPLPPMRWAQVDEGADFVAAITDYNFSRSALINYMYGAPIIEMAID
jgi:hypothetical protein